MVLPLLALLAAAGVGSVATVFVLAYWDEIVNWLRNLINALADVWNEIKKYIPNEYLIIGQKILDGLVQIVHKLYYKEGEDYVEQTTTRKISADKVPPHILKSLNQQEQNITQNMKEELKLSH